jgi:rhodanese-related sulfurtransferase
MKPGFIPLMENRQMMSGSRSKGIITGIFAVMIIICAVGCATAITREDLLKQLQSDASPLVVDVRSQHEYDRDHVPGAVHISFYSIGSGLKDLGYQKSDPVVLYCEHGPRSGIAGISLYLSGYEKVFSLEGNMKGWRKNEFPIEVVTH